MTFLTKQFLSRSLYGLIFAICCNVITAQTQKSELEIANEYYAKGRALYFAEEYEKSIEAYDKAIDIVNGSRDDMFLGRIYTRKGHSFLLDGQYTMAIDAYYYSLEIFKTKGNLEWEMICLSGLVTALKRIGQLDKAQKLTHKMLKLVEESVDKNKLNHGRVLATANEIYIALEKYDSVLYLADKGIEIAKKVDSKKLLLHLYVEKGMVYYHKQKYTKAFEYLFKTKDMLQKYNTSNEFFPTVLTNYFLASCYYQEQSYDTAIEYLLKTIKSAKEKDLKKMYVIQCYLLLANCYGEQQNFEKALHWHNEYMRLNASYEKEKDATANIIFEKEAEKLEENIAHLQYQQAKDQRVKIIAYSVTGILTIGLIGLVVFYTKKQKTNKKVFYDLIQKIDDLKSQKEESIGKKEVKGITIDDQKVTAVLQGLDMLEEQHYFLRQECSLTTMAKKIKTNSTYLSKIINTHKQKNFSNYINDLRIDFVIDKLRTDGLFRKYTIKAIAQEIGFKNSEAFTRAFHKNAGIYPSYFIKQLEKGTNSGS